MKLYCVILHWGMHVTIHLSKLIDCTTPRMNPNLNYGPWMIMVYQSWFISFNKCTILVWALTVGVTAREKHGGYRNLLYVPLSFAVNQKQLSTIKSIGKKKKKHEQQVQHSCHACQHGLFLQVTDPGKVRSSGSYLKRSQYKDRS